MAKFYLCHDIFRVFGYLVTKLARESFLRNDAYDIATWGSTKPRIYRCLTFIFSKITFINVKLASQNPSSSESPFQSPQQQAIYDKLNKTWVYLLSEVY